MSTIAPAKLCRFDDQSDAARYYAGLDHLVEMIEDLSLSRNLDEVAATVRAAVKTVVGADWAGVAFRAGDRVAPAGGDTDVWRERLTAGFAVRAWRTRSPVVVDDTLTDPRVPAETACAAGVRSLAVAPIRSGDSLGVVAAYWSELYRPSPGELQLLQALANSCAVAVQNAILASELDARVCARTRELEAELALRRRAEGEVRRLSLTDELTGLYNRRGFFLVAEQEWRVAGRAGVPSAVVFADLDGLKAMNDRHGHTAGDSLLRASANVLRQAFRGADVIARLGGDEFAVFAPGCPLDPKGVRARVDAAAAEFNRGRGLPLSLSLGVVQAVPAGDADFSAVVARADAAMYEDKRERRAFSLAASGGL